MKRGWDHSTIDVDRYHTHFLFKHSSILLQFSFFFNSQITLSSPAIWSFGMATDLSQKWVLMATAQTPTNIAVIKYWGKRDESLILPVNDSISVTLDPQHLCTTTTVSVSPMFQSDRMWLNGKVSFLLVWVRGKLRFLVLGSSELCKWYAMESNFKISIKTKLLRLV